MSAVCLPIAQCKLYRCQHFAHCFVIDNILSILVGPCPSQSSTLADKRTDIGTKPKLWESMHVPPLLKYNERIKHGTFAAYKGVHSQLFIVMKLIFDYLISTRLGMPDVKQAIGHKLIHHGLPTHTYMPHPLRK